MSEGVTPRSAIQPELPSFFQLVALESVRSTSDEVAIRAQSGAPEGLLVWARRQTRGRGRQGRQWQSPPGNLYCSLLLRPEVEPAAAAELGFVTGLAVRECVKDLISDAPEVRCKWPNDVLVNDAKIAGVLLEATVKEGAISVIVGIGINLVSHPDETSYPATNLRSQNAEITDPVRVLERLANAFLRWNDAWLTEGFARIRRTWLDHAAGLGEEIRVRLPDRTLKGKFQTLNERGGLELQLPGGETHIVTAGDVFLSRTATKMSG